MCFLWLRQLPLFGIRPVSVPPPTEDRSSPANTPVFSPSSITLLSFAWFYIFFPASEVLLSTLSWCSACSSVSEGIFLMYPWREMYSTSTYSSPIFFSQKFSIRQSFKWECFLWKKLIGELATDTTGFPSDSCGGLYKLLISSLKILKIMHIQVSRLNKICNF